MEIKLYWKLRDKDTTSLIPWTEVNIHCLYMQKTKNIGLVHATTVSSISILKATEYFIKISDSSFKNIINPWFSIPRNLKHLKTFHKGSIQWNTWGKSVFKHIIFSNDQCCIINTNVLSYIYMHIDICINV